MMCLQYPSVDNWIGVAIPLSCTVFDCHCKCRVTCTSLVDEDVLKVHLDNLASFVLVPGFVVYDDTITYFEFLDFIVFIRVVKALIGHPARLSAASKVIVVV